MRTRQAGTIDPWRAQSRLPLEVRVGNGAGVRVESNAVVPVPQRLHVDATLARRLVAAQFPQWADLPIRPVATSGWDNQTFHLGSTMSVRLPSAAEYALAVDKEHRWLPVLAPCLPLPIPVPLAKGVPGEGYPLPWSVYGWIDGETASADTIDDLTGFAVALAGFLVALGRVDPVGGPAAGLHNWFRGGPLETYDAQTRLVIDALDGRLPDGTATEIWTSALRATWDGRPVWFHGDVAHDNLLVRDGALAAVIDFGTCGVGDPACDLAIAWTLLSGASRDAFRTGLGVDPATWTRGRGWALWKALIIYAGERIGTAKAAEARHVLDEIFAESPRG
ncbi:MAG: hypothetical protein QOI74_4071 [Micromonosporaceae bacterium]|nr:hypothetical protein [Micromonosporaceae bacterium]